MEWDWSGDRSEDIRQEERRPRRLFSCCSHVSVKFCHCDKSRESVLYKKEGFTLAYSYDGTSSWSLALFGLVTAWCLMVGALDRTMPHTSVVTKNRGWAEKEDGLTCPNVLTSSGPCLFSIVLQAGLAHPQPLI